MPCNSDVPHLLIFGETTTLDQERHVLDKALRLSSADLATGTHRVEMVPAVARHKTRYMMLDTQQRIRSHIANNTHAAKRFYKVDVGGLWCATLSPTTLIIHSMQRKKVQHAMKRLMGCATANFAIIWIPKPIIPIGERAATHGRFGSMAKGTLLHTKNHKQNSLTHVVSVAIPPPSTTTCRTNDKPNNDCGGLPEMGNTPKPPQACSGRRGAGVGQSPLQCCANILMLCLDGALLQARPRNDCT